jgi:secreted PhoX family phosphatase
MGFSPNLLIGNHEVMVMRRSVLVSALAAAGLGAGAQAAPDFDLGLFVDQQLFAKSMQLFGVVQPVATASTASVSMNTAEADPTSLVTAAKGLSVNVVSAEANLGANIDMMALWPNAENPTHIIACNEQGISQPGVQRVSLGDGSVETILTGMSSCDPAHVTPWGTVIVGEEAGSSGSLLEIIDPLETTGVTYNRVTHTLSGADAGNVAYRPAVGHLSFEGVGVYPNGVMYYGDENRPSTGTGGGAYFKFIPSSLWTPGDAPITDLSYSPLANGQVYGLRLGKRSGNTDYGQGSELGKGVWVEIVNSNDANLRAAAAANNLTGFYRPEDLSADLQAMAEGTVRFCANNTGNEENDRNWGNTICITDGTLLEAAANSAVPEAQMFVNGSRTIAMMDNIAYQPGRGNWVIHEDRDAVDMSGDGYPFNNSIHLCLEDGADVNDQSDGCIRIVALNDLNAESTGGLFDASGKNFYFSVQHNVTGHGVILKPTGWK